MLVHFVKNGLVVNTVEQDDLTCPFEDQTAVAAQLGSDIGDLWDGENFSKPVGWVEQRRSELRAAVNALRDRKETEGFYYMGKVLDSTERSVQRINTTVQAAQAAVAAGQQFAVDWTCADNSTVALDAAGVIGMPVALAMRAQALHEHAKAIKMTIDAALGAADLAAVDVNAGWPAL